MESPLPFEDEVKALAFALDKQEEGVLVRRLLYPFFHVVHALHGLAVTSRMMSPLWTEAFSAGLPGCTPATTTPAWFLAPSWRARSGVSSCSCMPHLP